VRIIIKPVGALVILTAIGILSFLVIVKSRPANTASANAGGKSSAASGGKRGTDPGGQRDH
jgi:hypothetical protein